MDSELERADCHSPHAGHLRMILEQGGVAPAQLQARLADVDGPIRARIQEVSVDSFRRARPNAVVLVGTTGVGKTHAMAAFARLMLEKRHLGYRPEHMDVGQVLLWCSVPDLVGEWKSMVLRGADQERFLQRVLQVEHLCLDDLGAECKERGGREYDKGLAFVERVIRYRYDHYRPTSCTTNCTAEALILRYGAPVFSRLQHMSKWIEFPKGSRDRRLQLSKAPA